MTDYKICTRCSIHHFSNCDTCFGFGIKKDDSVGVIPIAACEAMWPNLSPLPEWEACPECHSTPLGMPQEVTTTETSHD